jgi:transcriptional regulator of NAD metabolism
VIVSHEIYGSIEADLIIHSRQDVFDFVEKVKAKKTIPLKELTGDCHYHTVEADSEEVLNRIEQRLKEKGYLLTF